METKLTKQTRWIASAYNFIGLYSIPLLTLVTVISMTNVFSSGYFSQYPFISGLWAFIFAATIDVNIVRLFLESHCEKVKGHVSSARTTFWVALGLSIVTGVALLVEGLQQSIGLSWNDGTVKVFISLIIALRVILVVVLMAREGCKLGASLVSHEETHQGENTDDMMTDVLTELSTLQAQKEQAVSEALSTLQTTVERLMQERTKESEPPSYEPIHLKVVNPKPLISETISEKQAFIREYLSEYPDASISTIVKAAKVKGLNLSQGYVSEQRKLFQQEAS